MTGKYQADFEMLMSAVQVLRCNIDKIDRRAERLMMDHRRVDDHKNFEGTARLRRNMRNDYEQALTLIVDKAINADQLRQVQAEIESCNNIIRHCIVRIEKDKLTLKGIETAARASNRLVGTLTSIL